MLSSSCEAPCTRKPEEKLTLVPGGGTGRDALLEGGQGGNMELPPVVLGMWHRIIERFVLERT